MANYPITANKTHNILNAYSSFYSDEYVERAYPLHLRDELHKDAHGKIHRYYRLHAREPHSIEMALQYDIFCPRCHLTRLKQVDRCRNSHELGLYTCPVCDKE